VTSPMAACVAVRRPAIGCSGRAHPTAVIPETLNEPTDKTRPKECARGYQGKESSDASSIISIATIHGPLIAPVIHSEMPAT
jgi:hypothetical protein